MSECGGWVGPAAADPIWFALRETVLSDPPLPAAPSCDSNSAFQFSATMLMSAADPLSKQQEDEGWEIWETVWTNAEVQGELAVQWTHSRVGGW